MPAGAPVGSRPASAPASGGKGGDKPAPGKVLMGKPIRTDPVPMRTLDLKMGNATVEGKVFAFECRETRRPGMWRLSFDMTDYTNSVTVQKNLTEKEAQALESAVKPGMWLRVQGKMEPTWDGKDIQLNPYHIQLAEHEARHRCLDLCTCACCCLYRSWLRSWSCLNRSCLLDRCWLRSWSCDCNTADCHKDFTRLKLLTL